MVQGSLEEFQINILKCFFITLSLLICLVVLLITMLEAHLPAAISQSILYGKLNLRVERNAFVRKLEVPKSWFRHFNIFAAFWALLALSLMLKGLLYASSAPECVMEFLDFFAGGKGRKVMVDSTSGLLAMFLITMQTVRRCYETLFIQIFSSQGRINLWYYFLAFAYYFFVVVVPLANTEGFVRGTIPSSFSFSKITMTQFIYCFIFYFSWSQQLNSNKLLTNLRKDNAGNKVSEEHFMPREGFFEYVSSPHMLFEVVMYAAICGIIPTCDTWWYVLAWVIVNQTESACLTHKWYKANIKDYPKERYAIYPKLL